MTQYYEKTRTHGQQLIRTGWSDGNWVSISVLLFTMGTYTIVNTENLINQ